MRLGKITGYVKTGNEMVLTTNTATMGLSFVKEDILRLRLNAGNTLKDPEDNLIISKMPEQLPFTVSSETKGIHIKNSCLDVFINFEYPSISISKFGKEILATTKLMADLIEGESTLRFTLSENEKIYGLGQDPMGNVNQRGHERRMWNEWGGLHKSANAGIPFYLSSQGYGLLSNSGRPTLFAIGEAVVSDPPPAHSIERSKGPWPWYQNTEETNPDELAIVIKHEELDVFVIVRESYDDAIEGYSFLTGFAPMPPKWTFGYMQSRNRYRSWEELMTVAKKYREKNIPCDTLVIDWLWFKEFGDLAWDNDYWSNAEVYLKELHAMGYHVMQAQHPFVSKKAITYEDFLQKGYLFGNMPDENQPIFDHSNPEAVEYWWEKFKPIADSGIDAYWIDMGEPRDHPQTATSYMMPRERIHNLYCILWAKGLYERHRKAYKNRIFSLSRTATAGIQKYGAGLWTNDVDSSWEVLKDSVPIGVSVCISGLPYWCTDIGGFATDSRFSAELYIRWLQWGTFCPLFRTHGTRPDNEAWSYGAEAEEIIKNFIELRYKLMPYIYSLAWEVTKTGRPMLRGMCMDYPEDEIANTLKYQFMFGPSILVAPVIDKDKREVDVYLPEGIWFDFWTDEKIISSRGGKWISAHAPLSRIPLFVKGGAIVPMTETAPMYIDKTPEQIDLHVYGNQIENSFLLYEDDGETYAYESGAYSITKIASDAKGNITTLLTEGNADFVPAGRTYNIVQHDNKKSGSPIALSIDYDLLCNGKVRIHISADAKGKELILNGLMKPEDGYKITDGNCYLRKDALPKGSVTSKDVAHLYWELSPITSFLPIKSSAVISLTMIYDGKSYESENKVTFGSGYLTRFSGIGFFDDTDSSHVAIMREIEANPMLPTYENGGKVFSWHLGADQEFNPMGYFDLRKTNITGMKNGKGEGYARCRIWAKADTVANIEVSSERFIEISINSEKVFSYEGLLFATRPDKKIKLVAGWNIVLVKLGVNDNRQMSGREIGFSIKLLDESGHVIESLGVTP